MPFLVDSIANAIQRREMQVFLIIHPVLAVKRDAEGRLSDVLAAGTSDRKASAESCMHLQVTSHAEADLPALAAQIQAVLADVRAAVEDWPAVVKQLNDVIEGIESEPPPLPAEPCAEGTAFLKWLRDHHFTFLGYRAYDLVREKGHDFLRYREGTGLGVLRRVNDESRARHKAPLSEAASNFARRKEMLIITKAYDYSPVHRPVRMDYVGVRTFGPDGEVNGEHRFLGLFTSTAYNERPRSIPLLREKVRRIQERANYAPKGHDGRALLHILESYPRDELLQVEPDDLYETALGILQLTERKRTALFVRRDPFECFVSCIVYVARDAYSTKLRKRFQQILEESYAGKMTDYYTQVGDSPLARLHYIIGTRPGDVPALPVEEVEARLVEAARSWSESLAGALSQTHGEKRAQDLLRRYGEAFPTAYTEAMDANSALSDITLIEAVLDGRPLGINLYRPAGEPFERLRLKICRRDDPIPLSSILPILEHMGLKVISEIPFRIQLPAGPSVWIHDFGMVTADRSEVTLRVAKEPFEVLLAKVWDGEVEDDGFNRLALRAGLDWRGIVTLRAYCKYLRQTGSP
ncbi:MAG: NAD-glutamate dehydrogenase [Planctomycetes bacterium]|nr:NAD-glutamate dehydrogenase [Planctomycetota bacterium]